MSIIDLDRWLEERGISRAWADSAVRTIRKDYPALTAAVKGQRDVVAELELVALVYNATNNRFVHTPPKPVEPQCYACAVGELHATHHPETEAEHKACEKSVGPSV